MVCSLGDYICLGWFFLTYTVKDGEEEGNRKEHGLKKKAGGRWKEWGTLLDVTI